MRTDRNNTRVPLEKMQESPTDSVQPDQSSGSHLDSVSGVDPLNEIPTRRILVVDDNADSAETMALLLKMSGHEVIIAHDGESTLEAASKHRPEIILLDVGLPGMHGYEVAQRLRTLPENENLVIVALTGYGQEQDRQRALEAGFDYYFVKPVDFSKLESLVKDLSRDLPD